MPVLERSELEASPLADLHAIADQLGLEGFRRLRKAELIDAILGGSPASAPDPQDAAAPASAGDQDAAGDGGDRDASEGRRSRLRKRRSRRRSGEDRDDDAAAPDAPGDGPEAPDATGDQPAAPDAAGDEPATPDAVGAEEDAPAVGGREHGEGASTADTPAAGAVKGVVEVLGNGSAFLRVEPPDPSDADVYISAAQVRRCELVSGDEVTGPVRTPRRSERYPSLVRVETINGAPADAVSDGAHYEDLPVAWPSERLALGAPAGAQGGDPTLEAIEWLTPLGLGSRAVIVGPHRSGKTETLKRLRAAIGRREEIELSVVLAGVRPEEIVDWSEGAPAPAGAVSFAASADAQGQLVERVIDAAKRLAARGSNAVVLIDGLSGLTAGAARKALAAARNLREAGSLTVIATAHAPIGGETTVIALDPALASTGREPIIDLLASGTLRAELLVGEEGAQAIARARAAALEHAGG